MSDSGKQAYQTWRRPTSPSEPTKRIKDLAEEIYIESIGKELTLEKLIEYLDQAYHYGFEDA